jgi:hypothetical protein
MVILPQNAKSNPNIKLLLVKPIGRPAVVTLMFRCQTMEYSL